MSMARSRPIRSTSISSFTVDPIAIKDTDQIVHTIDVNTVQSDDDVAGQQTGQRRRTIRLDLRQQCTHPVFDTGGHRVHLGTGAV